jgi:DNA-binding response OmpR family regulator
MRERWLQRHNILLVEDELDFARIMKMRLESNGYEVSIAEDTYRGTQEAIRGDYDLIILDLMMPAGGGFTLLERIKKLPAKESIPVMILTSSDLDEDAEKAKMLGADAFVLKTTRAEIIMELVKKLIINKMKYHVMILEAE